MKRTKKIFIGYVIALVLVAVPVTAFAAYSNITPSEIVAEITGRSVESVVSDRVDAGKTFGTIAAEAGVLDEFKAEILKMKKGNLAAQVESGTITQERADAILEAFEANQLKCKGENSIKSYGSFGASLGPKGIGPGYGGVNQGEGIGRRKGGRSNGKAGMCDYLHNPSHIK